MKIDLSKINIIRILDSEGKLLDEFEYSQISVKKYKDNTISLEIEQAPEQSNLIHET